MSAQTNGSATETPDAITLEKIRSGQRLLIFAILVNLAAVGVRTSHPAAFLMIALVAFFMAVVGLLRLMSGLEYSTPGKVGMFVLQFVPLINLISLIVICTQATKILRAAGFEVGFLGASARQ